MRSITVREIFRLLVRRRYRGYYCFEWEKPWHPEVEEPEAAFPHFAKVMHEYLAEAGFRNSHFAFAEEVTVLAADAKAHDKRPDVVLYLNGIALGVLKIKRSTVSVFKWGKHPIAPASFLVHPGPSRSRRPIGAKSV